MTTLNDIAALLEKQNELLEQIVRSMSDICPVPSVTDSEGPIRRMQQQSLQLAREGRREESIAMLKAANKLDSQLRREAKR